ncbi:MAG: glycoside hydrolase family 3 C-terminal domain-containing protein [Bacteroidales bacterium]|nr:glycoside hydrolase family 3 C-terminal domain-containing protein [Bacteroidales bacterium]
MKYLAIFAAVVLPLSVLSSCGKPQEVECDGYNTIVQKKGPTLGYSPSSGVGIIYKAGHAFKDLNRNGKLDTYEDWRKDFRKRAENLASQLSIEEIAGLMLYSGHQAVPGSSMGFGGMTLYGGKPYDESGAKPWDLSDNQKKFLSEDNLRAVLVTTVESPEVAARWNNNVQAFVEGLGHGIPANNSSDPRHETSSTFEFNAGAGGEISLWPSTLGLAATFDPSIVKEFGRIASAEYRALGIATALSPQIDLATEPRWGRFSGTFGEDPDLDTDLARAYVDGFQTSEGEDVIKDGWGFGSVNAMVKHWPSGGPEEGGRDAHFNFGKYAVYPGNNFEMHLRPFVEGAFNLDGGTGSASAVMPYYTISYGIDPSGKNVGNNFSHYIITDLLREKYGYDGVVCTDWGVTGDNRAVESFDGKCWGVETLSVVERHYEMLKAGGDQFGGNNDAGPVLEAYKMWVADFGEKSARQRFEQSAVRLLMNSFRTGLFENPYLDVEKTKATVGKPEFMQKGYEAQLRSIVMLKNHGNALPVKEKAKVYVPQKFQPQSGGIFGGFTGGGTMVDAIEKSLLSKYYDIVSTPGEADFAIVFMSEPATSMSAGYDVADRNMGRNGYVPISLQYNDYTATYARETSLAGGDPKEDFTNRSYLGKTVKTANRQDMQTLRSVRREMGRKPVIAVVSVTKPMVFSEIEEYASAILVSFGVQNQAILDVVSGKSEPSGLLPMQMPANMKTVELQKEDVPHDMEPYIDSDSNAYDFGFGMNWSGVIEDSRFEKYAGKYR